MQNNAENSTTDNTNEKQSSNATGSTTGKKKTFEFGRSMTFGGYRGQPDHGDDEPSIDEYDDTQG